ncbi:MAG: thioredoxin [archaeon]|jgi:thioredoxin 1|nr:thioredoxin [archaeon]
MSEHVAELNKKNFGEFIAKGKVVVDFWAEWCPPCRMLMPVFEEVAKKLKGKASFGKVNIEDGAEIAESFGVMGVPTLIFFKDGREVSRNSGFIEQEELVDLIKETLSFK